MFCHQCEQTAHGVACTVVGVCSKPPEVADLLDKIIYAARSLASVARDVRSSVPEATIAPADRLICEALFTTITNVNFDASTLTKSLSRILSAKDQLRTRLPQTAQSTPQLDHLRSASIDNIPKCSPDTFGTTPDERSLMQTLLYGLKGMCAYLDHAFSLGQWDSAVMQHVCDELVAGYDGKQRSTDDWLKLVLQCGEANLRAMELLDTANTTHFGNPTPTSVSLGLKKGKSIVVTGHDLGDLKQLLEQVQGKDINVYTHGEMLPAHGYPKLREHKNLAGHFGTAWNNQQREFVLFPGSILFTTNCLMKPNQSYISHVFTTGLVGWAGCPHIESTLVDGVPKKDFSQLIKCAESLSGYEQDTPGKSITSGFGHATLLSPGVAGKLIELVRAGKIRHIFLVGGCDGARPGRSYYSDFVDKVPSDCIVLTLACGKFRFFDKDMGNIEGIPRLIDVGQCNDAYSAILVAAALSKEFACDLNSLPLSFVLSWYEQKAVAILLTLFHLNIRNIKLGPTLPAFLSQGVLSSLVNTFNIGPITTVEADMKEMLERK